MMEKLVLVFIFFIPFQWALRPTEGVDLAALRVFAIVIVLLWLGKGLLEKKIIVPYKPAALFLISFLFLAALSVVWSVNEFWSLRKILFLVSFVPLILVFSDLMSNASFRLRAMQVLGISALSAAIVGLTQFVLQFVVGVSALFHFWVQSVLPVFLGPSFGGAVAEYPSLLVNVNGATLLRASMFFPDPHMFSLFLGMTLFPVLALFFYSNHKRARLFWGASAALIFIADALAFSRGGYAGLLAGAAAFFIPLFLQAADRVKRMRWTLIFLLLGFAVVSSPVGTRLVSSFSLADGSNSERLRLWTLSATSIAERPLLGTGLGNFPLVIKPSADYREPIYAHNLYLDIAAETGLVGAFFFIGFLVLSAYAAFRAWRARHDYFSLAIFASLVLFATHSFFETPIFSVHILPLLLLISIV